MSFESPTRRTRAVAYGLAAVLGPLAFLSACGDEEPNSWKGCTQAKIQPGVNNVGPSIFKRLETIDRKEGTNTQLESGVRKTNHEALVAFNEVYDQIYDEDDVFLQAGDVFGFCVNENRQVSFDNGGEILVRDQRLAFTQHHGEWQPTPLVDAAAK